MIQLDMDKVKLVRYLRIAQKQRERAATKFVQDYGPSSNTVAEISQEIAQLNMVINSLEAGGTQTDIEDKLKSGKK